MRNAIRRGEVWWADLPEPSGAEPGGTRPVLVLQANAFNASALDTVVVAFLTSNLGRATDPGNVVVDPAEVGLREASVINVTQLGAIDRDVLRERTGRVSARTMRAVDHGIAMVLGLNLADLSIRS